MEEQNIYLVKSEEYSDIHIVASNMHEAIEIYKELISDRYRDYSVQIDSITKVMTAWCKQ